MTSRDQERFLVSRRVAAVSCRVMPWSKRLYGFRLTVVAVAAGLVAGRTASSQPTLKDAFNGIFLVGAAINGRQFSGANVNDASLIASQFNAVSPENVLKWESVEPRPGVFAFDGPDKYVSFATSHGIVAIGHTLVWHNQTPKWVFEDGKGGPASRDTLIARMRSHIMTVVGRYRGRIRGWDVVNEAITEDGSMRQSPWMRIIGPDYVEMAFRFAHEADPAAELYYNDFSVEGAAKREGIIRLVKSLEAKGVAITAVGMQEHQKLDWPTPQAVDSAITEIAATGVRIVVTELDVDVLPSNKGQRTEAIERELARTGAPDPYREGLPDSMQVRLAHRYGDLMRVYVRHRSTIQRLTFWGVTDADSWLNNFPVRGRVNYPLLFDRAGRPKLAFDTVIAVARTATARIH